jgi:DNA-binding protein H-NS
MDDVGIRLEDVAAAIAEDEVERKNARYRSATGETWSGNGEMPQWLTQAVSAGQSVEHFADKPAQRVSAGRLKVDWREDPFAGSRLARAADPSVNTR